MQNRVHWGPCRRMSASRCVSNQTSVLNDQTFSHGFLASIPDPCEGVKCGAFAICVGGDCQCEDGYIGDPEEGCQLPGLFAYNDLPDLSVLLLMKAFMSY